jgi:hypothetical protein
VEKARQDMNELKERGGIVDPEPEHLSSISTGASKTSISQYEAAKKRFMTEKRRLEVEELKFRLEAEERKLWEAKQSEPRQSERIKIRERADPSRHQAYFDPQRVWRRDKVMCSLGLIAGFSTVCLGIGAAIICTVKYLSRILDPLPGQENRGIDTVTYDY